MDPDGKQDVVTTYEAYQAYAASTAAVGSKSSTGQAILDLGNWLGHAYVQAVNQVIDKAVNSYKTISGQNKQSVKVIDPKAGKKEQDKQDRKAKEKLDQQQANVEKAIEENTPSGKDGDNKGGNPKGGIFGKVAIGLAVTLGTIEQFSNPDASKDAHEAHEQKAQEKKEQKPQDPPRQQSLLERFVNWVVN